MSTNKDYKKQLEKYMKLIPEYFIENGTLKRKSANKILAISNFLPIPAQQICKDDGERKETYFAIEAYKLQGNKVSLLPAVLIKASNLPSMNWVTENWGFDANIEPPLSSKKDYLRAIINTIGSKKATKEVIYTHTGWRKVGDKHAFLYYGGSINDGGSISADNISVELDGNLERYNIDKASFTLLEVIDDIALLFKLCSHQIVFPLIAFVFLTPLNEFFRKVGYEPAFFVFLLGKTQTKKSTIAALMLSFFGRFTSSTLPANFKDTSNAIEKKGYLLKDVLMVVDDYHPVSNNLDKQNMDNIAQALARSYGDRVCRDRLNNDTSLRKGYIPRGNLLVTGENYPLLGQSGSARSLIIDIEDKDIKVGKEFTSIQESAAKGSLRTFMNNYIEWLIPKCDELPNKLKSMFLTYRSKAIMQGLQVNGRAAEIAAWMQIGMDFFAQFSYDMNLIDEEDRKYLTEEMWNVMVYLSSKLAEKSREDNPVDMFISSIKELMLSQRIFVEKYPGNNATNIQKGEMVGYEQDDKYYFIPNVIYNSVYKFHKQQDKLFPLSRTQLFKALASEKKIEIDDSISGRSYTKQKRFGNEKGRFLVMYKGDIFNGDE